MDTAAEYLAEAIECEMKAEAAQAEEARALLLTVAARWRAFAADAAEREADRGAASSASSLASSLASLKD